MALKLYVNTAASDLASALIRSQSDTGVADFPTLVVGDDRDYELYFVNELGAFETWSGSGTYTPNVAIGECGNPSGGTFTLTLGANTTAALAYNVSPAALQTALEALTSIGAGNVVVTGVAGQYYKVAFQGTKAATNMAEITGNATLLTPDSVVSVDTITDGAVGINEVQLIQLRENPLTFQSTWTPITNGWTAKLSTRTLAMVQRFALAGGTLAQTFQITVQDPTGSRRTFVKAAANIECTVIDPDSFVGNLKPTYATLADLAAATLATGLFTRETLSSTGVGNTNITRPSGSRNHTAIVTVTGTASTRTFSVLTTNTPAAGDKVFVVLVLPTTASIVNEVRNATSVGTLLKSITTDTTGQGYLVELTYSGSAWQMTFNDADILRPAGNLANLASVVTARANLKAPFSRSQSEAASFTVVQADDGMLRQISTAGGACLVTLPSAAAMGNGFTVPLQKVDSATNNVTTSPATVTLSVAGQTALLVVANSAWTVVMNYDPTSAPVSESDVILNLSTITALTGGLTTTLDGIVTAGSATALLTVVMLAFGTPRTAQLWQLVSGTDAEDGSFVIRPDDYNGTTNAVVWKRVL